MSYVTGDQLIKKLRNDINEMDVHQLKKEIEAGNIKLIDIREQHEWDQGHVEGAVHIPRGYLELQVEQFATSDRSQPVAVMCAGGVRSLLGARDLEAMGYENVVSVAGGFGGWKNAGYNFKTPRTLNEEQRQRYSRHTIMPEFGEEGQLKLLDSKVLLIGTGGLGSPAAIYLAAAGVGTLGLVDFDIVDTSNLQRQIIHRLDNVDKPKVDSAEETIKQLNPDINVIKHQTQITSQNAMEIIEDYDIVLNGSDNFPTRYLVNDACVLLGKKLVDASIFRFEGQITVYDTTDPDAPCYRCLYPDPPPPGEVPSCAEGGVLGVLPGIMGSLQAVEAIKLLLDLGEPLKGRLLMYDALDAEFRELSIEKDHNCPVCGDNPTVTELIDYEQFCGLPSLNTASENGVAAPAMAH